MHAEGMPCQHLLSLTIIASFGMNNFTILQSLLFFQS